MECFERGFLLRLEYIADNGYAPGRGEVENAFEAEIAISGIVPEMQYTCLHSYQLRSIPPYNARTSPTINRFSLPSQRRWAEQRIRESPTLQYLQRLLDMGITSIRDPRVQNVPFPPGRVARPPRWGEYSQFVNDAAEKCEQEFQRMKQHQWGKVTADGFAIRYHQDFTGMHRLVKEIFDLCEKKDNRFDFPIAQFSAEMELSPAALLLMKRQRKYFANSSCFGGGMKNFDALVKHFVSQDPGQDSYRDWQ